MADNDDSKNASGGKKKFILLAVLALVLVGASVGGTIAVLSMTGEEPQVEEMADENAAPAEPAKKPAIYYPLKPPYIVNIDGKGRRRYLQVEITVMVRDDDVLSALELHRPTIDHTINLIVGGQVEEDIRTAEGKEFLRLQILKELQAIFEKEIGKPGIEQALFTNFVM